MRITNLFLFIFKGGLMIISRTLDKINESTGRNDSQYFHIYNNYTFLYTCPATIQLAEDFILSKSISHYKRHIHTYSHPSREKDSFIPEHPPEEFFNQRIYFQLEEFTKFLAFNHLQGFPNSPEKVIQILGEFVSQLKPLVQNMEVYYSMSGYTEYHVDYHIFLSVDYFLLQRLVKTTYCEVFSNTLVFSYYRVVQDVFGTEYPVFTHDLLVYLIENQDLSGSEIFDIDCIQTFVKKIPFHGPDRIKFLKLVLSLKNSLKM